MVVKWLGVSTSKRNRLKSPQYIVIQSYYYKLINFILMLKTDTVQLHCSRILNKNTLLLFSYTTAVSNGSRAKKTTDWLFQSDSCLIKHSSIGTTMIEESIACSNANHPFFQKLSILI